ncbi:hypothetical protein Tco_1143060 [Tanacetum coccineum]
MSSAKLEIQSMVDVPIHQEDPAVQRTPLIDTVILMVTDKTTLTPTPPTIQAQVQMCSTSCWKDSSRESRKLFDIEKVAVRFSLRSLKPKRTIESRANRSSINLIRTLFYITCSSHNVKTRVIISVLHIILVVLPEHPSDTYVFTMKMEILLEPTSNKLMVDPTLILEILSRRFFLRLNLPDHRLLQAQDGERPQVDDQRLDLANDLKEAQDHIPRSITSQKTKITTSMYKISHEE